MFLQIDSWEERGEAIKNKRKRFERAKQTVLDEFDDGDGEAERGDEDGKLTTPLLFSLSFFSFFLVGFMLMLIAQLLRRKRSQKQRRRKEGRRSRLRGKQ